MTVSISRTPNLTAVVKSMALSKGNVSNALGYAQGHWGEESIVYRATKAAVEPMASDTGISPSIVANEFMGLFRSQSVVGRLAAKMRPTPFRVKVPRELESGAAIWVREQGSVPVRAITFAEGVELEACKAGLIVVFTEELARHSKPSAEETVRSILVGSTVAFIDSSFLSDDAPSPGEAPGGILHGQETHSSTGGSAAQVAADLAAMGALLTSWRAPAWIMKPCTFMHVCALRLVDFLQGGTPLLLGFPVYTSIASPQQIVLLDAGSVLLADEGQTEISLAQRGTVTLGDGLSPETEQVVSLWANNLAALKVFRYVSWQAAGDGIAAVMETSF
jgi:HK97 family phage major capsid protein